MIEPNAGSILIDDIDISTLPREAVRGGLIAIPQDPYFLAGTVRLNADPYCKATDKTITEALVKVGLWDNLGGLDVKFDIDMLSHGQRQLFCLARAMLGESKIVVLDEVTSSVDSETDKLMQCLIREEFANRTIIAVAHRLSTILDFDRVVVLQEGVIMECDSPKALLARQSAFRALYEQYNSKKIEEASEDVEVTPDEVEGNTWDGNEGQNLPSQAPDMPRNEVEDFELEVGEFQLPDNQPHQYTPATEGNQEEEAEDEFAIEHTDRTDESSDEEEEEEEEEADEEEEGEEDEEGTATATEEGNKRSSLGWLRRMISNELLVDPESSGSPSTFEGLGDTTNDEGSRSQDQQ